MQLICAYTTSCVSMKLPVASNLMYAMGNVDYSDSQRHAAMTLQASGCSRAWGSLGTTKRERRGMRDGSPVPW